MFKICGHIESTDIRDGAPTIPSGFHITYANGWTASVQWSTSNYCERKAIQNKITYNESESENYPLSSDAECYAWHADGAHIDDVLGYQKPEEVAMFLQMVASFAPAKPVKK